MKFNLAFSIDDTEMIKLEWDVPVDECGHLYPEKAGDLIVYERDVDEGTLDAIRRYMWFMVKGYLEGVENERRSSNNEEDES